MKLLCKENVDGKTIIISRIPNNTSFKKIKEKIMEDFEPRFFAHCSLPGINYNYKNNSSIKHSFTFKKNNEEIIIVGKAWDPVWEKALKENPVNDFLGNKIETDAQIIEEKYFLQQI